MNETIINNDVSEESPRMIEKLRDNFSLRNFIMSIQG